MKITNYLQPATEVVELLNDSPILQGSGTQASRSGYDTVIILEALDD